MSLSIIRASFLLFLVLLSSDDLSVVNGHGLMDWPPSRSVNDMSTAGLCHGLDESKVPQNGTCLWFNQGCTIGCKKCTGGSKGCSAPMKPTLNDPKYRTYHGSDPTGYKTYYHPWRAPGFSPVESPCGLAGGWYTEGAPGNGGIPPAGIKQGRDGRTMPESEKQVEWKAGSTPIVSWSVIANHGGGYAYRLCPKTENITEECFQRHHLQFVGDTQWIQYGTNESNRTGIPAVRVSTGTYPPGSQWTRNPIPACNDDLGGAELSSGCGPARELGPQFDPPLPGLFGFGYGRCGSGLPGKNCTLPEYYFWHKLFNFNMIDMVQIPANLTKGKYLVSFRWESEQTPQIWANCADVVIT